MLPKEQFLEFLFVPLNQDGKEKMMKLIKQEPILNLISKMIQIENRIDIQTIRKELQLVVQIKNTNAVSRMNEAIQRSMSACSNQYIDMLKHLS